MLEVKEFAAAETRRMFYWKVVVLTLILLTGAGVSVGVHTFLHNKQKSDFETEESLARYHN